jgi:hypothetical protein
MPVPGEVYFLPPESIPGGDKKTRRHVLLSACPPEAEAATLAYASTQATEASHGAAHVLLNPFATQYKGTGFDQATYIYPSRLFTTDMADLPAAPVGHIIHEMPRLQRALLASLGVGSGTWAAGTASGSLRGRLVELDATLADHGARYALIVTEPRYSLRLRHQTVVPVLDGTKVEATPNDVVAEDGAWLKPLRMKQAILAVPDIFSLWHRTRISRPLDAGVGEATMNAVDEAIRRHFGL